MLKIQVDQFLTSVSSEQAHNRRKFDKEFTSEESRSKISCGVDGVAAVEAEAHANGQHGEANEQGHQLSAYLVISMTVMKMMVMMANMDRHYLATHLVIIDH